MKNPRDLSNWLRPPEPRIARDQRTLAERLTLMPPRNPHMLYDRLQPIRAYEGPAYLIEPTERPITNPRDVRHILRDPSAVTVLETSLMGWAGATHLIRVEDEYGIDQDYLAWADEGDAT